MVEADSHFKLFPTSILDIYKVFEHIDMLFIASKGAFTMRATQVCPVFICLSYITSVNIMTIFLHGFACCCMACVMWHKHRHSRGRILSWITKVHCLFLVNIIVKSVSKDELAVVAEKGDSGERWWWPAKKWGKGKGDTIFNTTCVTTNRVHHHFTHIFAWREYDHCNKWDGHPDPTLMKLWPIWGLFCIVSKRILLLHSYRDTHA